MAAFRNEVVPVASIALKHIPDDLYERLRAAAQAHGRSINSELIACLEMVLKPHAVAPEEQLERLRRIRPASPPSAVTPEEIQQAIETGRP